MAVSPPAEPVTLSAPPPAPTGRAWFLDWLRILALGALVLYHVGMLYVRWDFHVKSPHAGAALEPWMRLTEPWRMSLLFLVSGAATALMWRGLATGALLRRRARQLLLPLLCGMLLLVPPQAYFEVLAKHGYTGSYAEFMALYLRGYGGFCQNGKCLILPTWNHLWFLPYLWLYTALLAAAVALWPGTLALLARGAARLFATRAALLLLPMALLALLRWGLYARYPQTYALWGDGYAHPLFGGMFLLGVALAGAPVLWPRLAALRWAGLLLALLAWALLAWALLVFGPALGLRPGAWRPVCVAVQQWGAIVAAVGFAYQHLNHDHPWRAWLTRAVFPVYLLHQTVLIALSQWLRPAALPPLAEGLLIVALTLGLCLLAYRLLLPWPRLHVWFGLGAGAAATTRATAQ